MKLQGRSNINSIRAIYFQFYTDKRYPESFRITLQWSGKFRTKTIVLFGFALNSITVVTYWGEKSGCRLFVSSGYILVTAVCILPISGLCSVFSVPAIKQFTDSEHTFVYILFLLERGIATYPTYCPRGVIFAYVHRFVGIVASRS
jgi:hypothetical protein